MVGLWLHVLVVLFCFVALADSCFVYCVFGLGVVGEFACFV